MTSRLRAISRRLESVVGSVGGDSAQVAGRAGVRPGAAVACASYTTTSGTSTTVHRRIVMGVREHGYGAELV